jgi:hypothetical protein
LYYEIPCIATSAKTIKWTKVGTCTQIWNFVPRSRFLLFLLRIKYKIFHNKILHTGRINHRLHSSIFFEFFQNSNFEFFAVWKNELHEARAPYWRSHWIIQNFLRFGTEGVVAKYSSLTWSMSAACVEHIIWLLDFYGPNWFVSCG